jgi:hypothetical protein
MARYYKEIAELLEKERAFTEAIEYYVKVPSLPSSFLPSSSLLLLLLLLLLLPPCLSLPRSVSSFPPYISLSFPFLGC